MSIYCYINNNLEKIPSKDIENISSLDHFKIFIQEKFNIKNTFINCNHNFSTTSLVNLLNSNEKVNENYMVTTDNDTNPVKFIILNNLNNMTYLIPKLMTLDEFKKNIYYDNIEIFVNNKKMNDDEFFIEGNTYLFKII